ncbi:MAG: o-succinylbenzoate synthase [Agromyces sp.]
MLLPEFDELAEHLHVVQLPLVTAFRGLTVRETALLRGPMGWTEFAPFVEYDDVEAANWLRATIEYGWDSELRAPSDSVRVNATVPAVPASEVPGVLARFEGCRTAKIKVAADAIDADVERVAAVRRALGPEGRIRIDANGGWTVDEAERAIRRMSPFDLEYVEQPCESVEELAELRERIRDLAIDIAADESVRRAEDPLAVAQAGAADLLIVKVAPLGGVRRAEALIAEAGLPVVVSSALESSIGLGMGALLASRLADGADAGLGTAALFTDDVAHRGVVSGVISAARMHPDPDALRRLAAPTERAEWWRERLLRCAALLSDG